MPRYDQYLHPWVETLAARWIREPEKEHGRVCGVRKRAGGKRQGARVAVRAVPPKSPREAQNTSNGRRGFCAGTNTRRVMGGVVWRPNCSFSVIAAPTSTELSVAAPSLHKLSLFSRAHANAPRAFCRHQHSTQVAEEWWGCGGRRQRGEHLAKNWFLLYGLSFRDSVRVKLVSKSWTLKSHLKSVKHNFKVWKWDLICCWHFGAKEKNALLP